MKSKCAIDVSRIESKVRSRISSRCPCYTQQISCILIKNRQDACSTKNEFTCRVGILPALGTNLTIENRQDACSTKNEFTCRVGILPALGTN
ncbi:hypothetical protein QT990_21090, partial [Microcoleus sp. T3_B1]